MRCDGGAKARANFRILADAGIETLVMGGHAVRYYGVGRNTVDFDLVTAICTRKPSGNLTGKTSNCSRRFVTSVFGLKRRAIRKAGRSTCQPCGVGAPMDLAVQKQLVTNNEVVEDAFVHSEQSVAAAFLFPYVNDQRLRQATSILSSTFKSLLSNVERGSPKHFLLIEVVRRDYKRRAIERDRADKQEQLRKLGISPTSLS